MSGVSVPAETIVIGRRRLQVRFDGAGLVVDDADGCRLDPRAAEVLIALGGPQPEWLGEVEALEAVARFFGGDIGAVCRAGSAIGAGARGRAVLARTSDDYAVLVALAAFGQYQIGANPHCDGRLWELVRNHRDPTVWRQALQHNEVLPPALATFPDAETRRRVAANPLCPAQLLAHLAGDDPPVRVAVGANRSTPPLTLLGMSRDPDVWLRRAVAANPSCPPQAFNRLLWDPQAVVRNALVLNPVLPVRRAARQVYQDPTSSVRAAMAGRIDLPGSTLGWLERYARRDAPQQYKLVRQHIAAHPNCSDRLRARLERIDARLAENEVPRRQGRSGGSSPAGGFALLACVIAAIAALVAVFVVVAGAATVGTNRGPGLAGVVIGVLICVAAAGTFAFVRRRAPFGTWRPPMVSAQAEAVTIVVCGAAAIVTVLAAALLIDGAETVASRGGPGVAGIVVGSTVFLATAAAFFAFLRRQAPFLNWRPPYLRIRHRRRPAGVLLVMLLFGGPIVSLAAAEPAFVVPAIVAIVVVLRLVGLRRRRRS